MAKQRVPAVAGLFTMDEADPRLIGGRSSNGSYFFPKDLGGTDPHSDGRAPDEVELSNRGRIWSYTNSAYPPPPPFVVTTEPFVPIVIAAVVLPAEQMVVLGQVVPGYTVDDLHVGMEVQLVLDTLYEDDDNEYLVWKWKPTVGGADQAGTVGGADQAGTVGGAAGETV
jgi:uncharacterized OB-fold protein